MIKHEVIIHKPAPTKWYNNYGTSKGPEIKSQADLDHWINEAGFQEGDFVTYSATKITDINLPYGVVQITKIFKKYNELTYKSYGTKEAELIMVKSLAGFERKDDVVNLRHLTEDEWVNKVKPYLDKLLSNSKSP